MHSFPVSATISAVKKRRKETVATERIQRESGRLKLLAEYGLQGNSHPECYGSEEKKIHQGKFIS